MRPLPKRIRSGMQVALGALGALLGLLLVTSGCKEIGRWQPPGENQPGGRAPGDVIEVMPLWGGPYVTTTVRLFQESKDGPPLVELRDQAPAHIDPAGPVAFWTVWNPGEELEQGLLFRALDARFQAGGPEGTHWLYVRSYMLARMPSGERGLLVLIAFDPAKTRPSTSPLDEEVEAMLRAARREGLLTEAQSRRADGLLVAYAERYGQLLESWRELVARPQDGARRDRFLRAFVGLRGEVDDLGDTDNFYSQEQRVALRQLGHAISGRAYGGERDQVHQAHLRNYPLGQLVASWNEMPEFLGLPPSRPALRVREERRHEEVDLNVTFNTRDPPERQVQDVLEVLLRIDGIEPAG